MHRPAARHSDRAFVRRAVHSQNPRAVVLVANAGAFPSATAAMRALSEIRSPCAGHAPHASTPAGCPFRGRPHRDRPGATHLAVVAFSQLLSALHRPSNSAEDFTRWHVCSAGRENGAYSSAYAHCEVVTVLSGAVDGIANRLPDAVSIVVQPALGALALKLGPGGHGEPLEERVGLAHTVI